MTTALAPPTLEDIRDNGWRPYSACRGDDNFLADPKFGPMDDNRVRNRHICIAHCPVIKQCLEFARENTPRGIVMGGIAWDSWSSRPALHQPTDPGCGPWCAKHRGLPPVNRDEGLPPRRKRRTPRPRSTDDKIALRLGARRAELGWNLDVASAKTGCSRGTISRLERGELSPTVATLLKITQAYGLSLVEITNGV